MSEQRSNTEPLKDNKNREEPFWRLIRSAQSKLITSRKSSKRNNYHRKRNYRKRPSFKLYSINHHQFNKYGFNVLDYCNYKGISFHESGANTYSIDNSGNANGDLSSLKISQKPDRFNSNKTYSLLDRQSTKNAGVKGVDSVTQFIIIYNGWDDNPSPRIINQAKKERNRFFRDYAKAGNKKTAYPAPQSSTRGSTPVAKSNSKISNKFGNHKNSQFQSQIENALNKKTPYQKQINYNHKVHFEDEATKALKTTFGTTIKSPETVNNYAHKVGENTKDAKQELTSYSKVLRATSKFMHKSHLPHDKALDEAVLGISNNVKAYKKHLPLIKKVRKNAINHASKYVNDKIVDNSVAMDYLHNKRGLPKSEVNYFINRGLVRGLKGYQFYSKKEKKQIKVDPRLEFLWRIPKSPVDAHTNNEASNKHQPISADAGLSDGIHNGKLAGASYIYLLPKHTKNPKTNRIETHYDKDHAAFGNSKKVDNNSIKNYGFNFHVGNGKAKLHSFEAPIDALSFLYLNRNNPKVIKNSTFLALDGAGSKSKSVQSFINAQFPKGNQFNHVILCPDNDVAGSNLIQVMGAEFGDRKNYVNHRKPNQKLISAMVPVSDNGSVDRTYALQKKAGVKVNGKTSPFNKDWNEMLQKATFDGVKFPKAGQPMNLAQYNQHAVNQFMKSLPTTADKKRFVGFADAVGKMDENKHTSSELINVNNPRIKVLESALNGMSSRPKVLASKIGVSPKVAKKEIRMYMRMTNLNSTQQNNFLKSKPKYLRNTFTKNRKAIMLFSINTDYHGYTYDNHKYGKEKFNKFMGNIGNFMSPSDIKRTANNAYQKEFGKPYRLSKPVAQIINAPYHKPTDQVSIENALNQMSPKSAKLFATATKMKSENLDRVRYVYRHPRTFRTTKNIYGSQVMINQISRKAIFNQLKNSNKHDLGVMGKLTNSLRQKYGNSYSSVINTFSKQYMYTHRMHTYKPLNIVKNPTQRHRIQNYRKIITYNNKLAWKNYRNYMIRRYHKDPAKLYSKKYQKQSKQAKEAHMSTKDMALYGKVAKTAHSILIDTDAGKKAMSYLNKHHCGKYSIQHKNIGYIPSGKLGTTVLDTTFAGIHNQMPNFKKLGIVNQKGQSNVNGKIIFPNSKSRGLTTLDMKTGQSLSIKPVRTNRTYRRRNTWHRRNYRYNTQRRNNSYYNRNRNYKPQSPLAKRRPSRHTSFIFKLSKPDRVHAVNLIDNQAKSKLSNNMMNKNLYKRKSVNDYRQMSSNGQRVLSGLGISKAPANKLNAFVHVYKRKYSSQFSTQNNKPQKPQNNNNKDKAKLVEKKKLAIKRDDRGNRK